MSTDSILPECSTNGDRYLPAGEDKLYVTQNNANHVHTVIRDLKNDFSGDQLFEHYGESQNKVLRLTVNPVDTYTPIFPFIVK